jgi:pyridinium-3,5-biscarboxylic acid mononucleotide synthase
MDEASLRNLLEQIETGELSIDDAVRELRRLPYADLGFAKVDHHREIRNGFAEAVFGEGKTPEQVAAIAAELVAHSSGAVMVTRATTEQFEAVRRSIPEAVYDPVARVIVCRKNENVFSEVLAVVSAGTSDEPVAREAAVVAEALGIKVERVADVGAAGLHRLTAAASALERADVVIVVAGMDGVLPSIIGGLVSVPVVAVPTSVGYGAGAGGIAPLLTMLNSCAAGVVVTNIDNGFGAARFAAVLLASRRR